MTSNNNNIIQHKKREQLRAVFDDIDQNKDMTIDKNEIYVAFQKLGIQLSQEAVKEMLEKIDLDHNDTIDFDEFETVFSQMSEISNQNVLNYWSQLVVHNGSDFNVPIPHTKDQDGLFKFFIAGAIGGTTSRTVVAPLERLMIMAQVDSGKGSMYQNIKDIYGHGGIKEFYKGNGIGIIRGGLYTGFVCYTFTYLIKYFHADKDLSDPIVKMTAGALAGIFATSLVYPLDLIHTRLAGNTNKTNLNTIVKEILQKEGFYSLITRGLLPSILVIAPFVAIDKLFYTTVKKTVQHNFPTVHPLATFFLGACTAAITATSVTYPIDLIRKRLQMQGVTTFNYKNSLDGAKQIIQKEGIRGLYRGIVPSYLKVIPAVSTSYLALEFSLQNLNKKLSIK